MKIERNQGFTLIEILVVVAIIGILMSMLAGQLIGRASGAKVDLARGQISQIEAAIEMYKLDNGRYPSEEQGLEALVSKPTLEPVPRRWAPYAKASQIRDPWGAPFQYAQPGEHNPHSFDIWTIGPDAGEDGEGTVGNWEETPE